MPSADAWNAAHYVCHSSLQEAMAAQVLSFVELRGDERVLDLGCGDGRISARLAAERVPRGSVLGVDVSPDMVAFAQTRHADVGNLAFVVGDARQARFADEFDAVVSFNALHWLPNPAPAFTAIRAALVPRGKVWLRLVTQGPVTSLEETVERLRRDAAWSGWFESFADPYLRLRDVEVAALARDSGLALLQMRTRLERWDFGNREAFFGFCRAGLGAWTCRLPAELQDRFVEAALDGYAGLEESEGATVFRFYQTDLALETE